MNVLPLFKNCKSPHHRSMKVIPQEGMSLRGNEAQFFFDKRFFHELIFSCKSLRVMPAYRCLFCGQCVVTETFSNSAIAFDQGNK